MAQALYRKHRPKTLDEVVGQEHVTSTIKNALKSGGISHAYLFTGPKGVGKTSVARILAHEINQLKYDESNNHLDIIEIDAASNRRIDEIRDLRDKVHIAPSSAKYKVYIIDEVHMLTKESFNALLKTLEEPPDHVVFILATTETHKLPDTIISRTQHFNFKPIDEKVNTAYLQQIATKESIDLDPDAAELISKHGSGSFRDSISMLDQLSATTTNKISISDVQNALGIAPDDLIKQIVKAIDMGSSSDLVKMLLSARTSGYNSSQIAVQISDYLRLSMINGTSLTSVHFKLLKDLISVPSSQDPDTLLEIILLEALYVGQDSVKQPVTIPNKEESALKDLPPTEEVPPKNEIMIEDLKPEPHVEVIVSDKLAASDEKDPWQKVLASLKLKHNTLYSVARMAECVVADNKVELRFTFPFHYKRIVEPKNNEVLETTIHSVLGPKYQLECILTAKPGKANIVDNDNIKDISNIFGDVEVLES